MLDKETYTADEVMAILQALASPLGGFAGTLAGLLVCLRMGVNPLDCPIIAASAEAAYAEYCAEIKAFSGLELPTIDDRDRKERGEQAKEKAFRLN